MSDQEYFERLGYVIKEAKNITKLMGAKLEAAPRSSIFPDRKPVQFFNDSDLIKMLNDGAGIYHKLPQGARAIVFDLRTAGLRIIFDHGDSFITPMCNFQLKGNTTWEAFCEADAFRLADYLVGMLLPKFESFEYLAFLVPDRDPGMVHNRNKPSAIYLDMDLKRDGTIQYFITMRVFLWDIIPAAEAGLVLEAHLTC